MPELEEQLLAAAGAEEEALPEVETPVETPVETAVETAPVETAVETETVGEETTETEQTQQQLALAQYIKAQYGEDFTGKYQSDAELLKGLVHAAKKIGERDEDAQWGRWFRENPQQAYQWLQQQPGISAQQAAQIVQSASTQQNGRPEYDPDWARQVEVDENGRATGVKPGYDPSIAQKFNSALEYYHKQQRELVFNPQKALEPVLAETAKQYEERLKALEERQEQIRQHYEYQRMVAEGEQLLASNAKWMFVNGDRNSQVLTAPGRVYRETILQWAQKRPDMQNTELHEIAMNAVHARFPQQPATKPVAKPGAARVTNVQKQTASQELQRRDGESAFEFLQRVEKTYPGTIGGLEE